MFIMNKGQLPPESGGIVRRGRSKNSRGSTRPVYEASMPWRTLSIQRPMGRKNQDIIVFQKLTFHQKKIRN
jgi:hypothetical protein